MNAVKKTVTKTANRTALGAGHVLLSFALCNRQRNERDLHALTGSIVCLRGDLVKKLGKLGIVLSLRCDRAASLKDSSEGSSSEDVADLFQPQHVIEFLFHGSPPVWCYSSRSEVSIGLVIVRGFNEFASIVTIGGSGGGKLVAALILAWQR